MYTKVSSKLGDILGFIMMIDFIYGHRTKAYTLDVKTESNLKSQRGDFGAVR